MGLKEFYDEIEIQLNKKSTKENILVLGCGSGLEIERIRFKANVTAIDISPNMLKKLENKQLYKSLCLNTICGSFLDLDFGKNKFDIVLSCYAMHHFDEKQKMKHYNNILNSLKEDGVFINGDSMADNFQEELLRFERAKKIYEDKKMPFGSLRIDAHFCLEHELEILMKAGFQEVILEREWKRTRLYRAIK